MYLLWQKVSLVDNLEMLKCLISFCLQVYYFLMAKIHLFKFEWNKKGMDLLCKGISRSDVDVCTYAGQQKGISYLNDLIPEAVVLS